MANKNTTWLEDLDDLINRIPDLYIPEPARDRLMQRMEAIQEEVLDQIDLRSTEWEA